MTSGQCSRTGHSDVVEVVEQPIVVCRARQRAQNSRASSARLLLDSTRLGLMDFLTSRAANFARFINELARANSRAAHMLTELETPREPS